MAASPTVVVVGAGQGGFQIAASLREGGFDGRVVLLGEEPHLPYQRPPLSKDYLAGACGEDALPLRPASFLAANAIEHLPGERAAAVDRAARRVRLARGGALGYGHLVLATGARNRTLPVPGAELDGVAQLRTLAEAAALRERLATASEAVVIGAGFIGLEFATVARKRGLGVTVLEAADRVMARSVSPAVSTVFQGMHATAGVRFEFGALATRVLGAQRRVVAVETADGRRFPADLVLVGIGVVPNAELASAAGLPTGDGIVVDDHLATPDPTVSAIGDAARHPSRFAPAGAAAVRIESVQNAVDGARCVAARLLGRGAPYAALPWFWSDQAGAKLQIAGLATPHDRAVVRGDPAAGALSVFCFRGGRLVGVESVSRPLDHVLARKLLSRGGGGLTPEQAADAGFDLKAHANATAPVAAS